MTAPYPKRTPLQELSEKHFKLITGITDIVKQAISELDVNSLLHQSVFCTTENAGAQDEHPEYFSEIVENRARYRLAICQPKPVRGDFSDCPNQPVIGKGQSAGNRNLPPKLHSFAESSSSLAIDEKSKLLDLATSNGASVFTRNSLRFSIGDGAGSVRDSCGPLNYMKDVREYFAIDFNDRFMKAGDATRVGEVVDLQNQFEELDPHGSGFVSAEALLERTRASDKRKLEESFPEYAVHSLLKKAIIAVNNLVASHDGPPDEMSIETFIVLMLTTYPQLEAHLGRKTAKFIMAVRDMCIKDSLKSRIASICRLDSCTLGDASTPKLPMQRIEIYFEPVVASVILLNALVIGLSLDNDPDWPGWIVFEILFTAFFVMEQVIKMRVSGIMEHVLGEDWCWNWFDLVLVICAVGDSVISVLEGVSKASSPGNSFSQLTGLRIIRFVRITRLIRLLHLKMFKELQLMVRGVFAGLKTLWWAIVLLLGIVYSFGLLLRQVMDPDDHVAMSKSCEQAIKDELKMDHSSFFADGIECNRGAYALTIYGRMMFDSVGRSMLTVFNCFTDSCIAPDGTPLLWHIWDTHGFWIIFVYVLLFIFVTFGVFNLILAIFVENTMSYALVSDQHRTSRRYADHVRQARKLQQLLIKICTTGDDNWSKVHAEPTGLRRFFTRSKDMESMDERHLNLRVDRDAFDRALEEKDVKRLFEDLEVSMNSRNHLFDILDADGNGYLAVNELVDGILRLRGPTDKGDVVANGLMMRCLQRHILRFEQAVLQNQHTLQHLFVSLVTNTPLSPHTRQFSPSRTTSTTK